MGENTFLPVDFRSPYVYQYDVSLQHNLFSDLILETNYVGSSSHGLTSLKDINPMVLGTYNRVLNLAPGNATCGAANVNQPICYSDMPEFPECCQRELQRARSQPHSRTEKFRAWYGLFHASLHLQPQSR